MKLLKYIPFVLLIIALPIFLFAAYQYQQIRSKAASGPLDNIHINPEQIYVTPGDNTIYLSALAYDTNGSPIFSDISYQWGLSTSDTIGKFITNGTSNLASFEPSVTVKGRGDIWVEAFDTTGRTAMKSIPVYVGVTPTPTPTPAPITFGNALKFINNQVNSNANGISIDPAEINNRITAYLTFEGWFKMTGTSSKQWLFHIDMYGYGSVDVFVSSQTLAATDSLGAGTAISGGYVSLSTWHHVAFTTDNYTCRLFLDGKLKASSTAGACRNAFSAFTVNQPILIGAYPGTDNLGSSTLKYGFTGQMDDVRITNGVKYTQNFSLPITPFPNDRNYLSLFHFDVQNGTIVANAGIESGKGILQGPTTGYSYVSSTVPTTTPTPIPTNTPMPSPSPTPTPGPSPTPTPGPVACNTADINKDGSVDGLDLNILLADFFKTSPANPRSDINLDGVVDITDYSLLVAQFNKNTGSPCL